LRKRYPPEPEEVRTLLDERSVRTRRYRTAWALSRVSVFLLILVSVWYSGKVAGAVRGWWPDPTPAAQAK
jgi:hypothetical protein